MGKKHYSDAIDCYTRGINQKALGDTEQSTLYSNRAHVNLLLGNFRRALQDAEEAIKLCPTNVKVVISKSIHSYIQAYLSNFSVIILFELCCHDIVLLRNGDVIAIFRHFIEQSKHRCL